MEPKGGAPGLAFGRGTCNNCQMAVQYPEPSPEHLFCDACGVTRRVLVSLGLRQGDRLLVQLNNDGAYGAPVALDFARFILPVRTPAQTITIVP